MQYSQGHLKTMVYAEFGGQTECIMGNSKIENGAKWSFWRALDSKTSTTTSTRFSQYKVVLAGEPASFGRENAGAQYS